MSHNEEKQRWMAGVVQEYEGRLVRFAYKLLRNLERARDVVQDVFLSLWQEDHQTLQPYLRAWLFKACRNRALDILRKEKRVDLQDGNNDEEPSTELDPSMSYEKQEQIKNLMSVFQKLSVQHREVLRLKFQEELSYKEIAQVTGHSLSYVGVLIHEGLIELRTRAHKSSLKEASYDTQ